MKKYLTFLLSFSLILFLNGCGEDEEGEESGSVSTTQGWHFSGRDCLACHNVDLGEDKSLLVGGTVYKSKVIQDQDDLTEMCGGDIVLNLYDGASPLNLIYSSKDYKDVK